MACYTFPIHLLQQTLPKAAGSTAVSLFDTSEELNAPTDQDQQNGATRMNAKTRDDTDLKVWNEKKKNAPQSNRRK